MMEAFAFRVHPQTSRLIELLDADEIGEVRSIGDDVQLRCRPITDELSPATPTWQVALCSTTAATRSH